MPSYSSVLERDRKGSRDAKGRQGFVRDRTGFERKSGLTYSDGFERAKGKEVEGTGGMRVKAGRSSRGR